MKKVYEQPEVFTEQFRNAQPIALLLAKSASGDNLVDNQFDPTIGTGDLSTLN